MKKQVLNRYVEMKTYQMPIRKKEINRTQNNHCSDVIEKRKNQANQHLFKWLIDERGSYFIDLVFLLSSSSLQKHDNKTRRKKKRIDEVNRKLGDRLITLPFLPAASFLFTFIDQISDFF